MRDLVRLLLGVAALAGVAYYGLGALRAQAAACTAHGGYYFGGHCIQNGAVDGDGE
jgi:hypothetical protein